MLQGLERHILRGIRKGEPEAFETVICQYYKSVFSFLAYLCGDKNAAEDLTQDTFTSAWANINGYKRQASLKTWLYRIAYNRFLDSERKSRQSSALADEFRKKSFAMQTDSDPLKIVTKDEYSRIIFEAMQKLEPAEYAVIVLHYIQGLSYREMESAILTNWERQIASNNVF